MNRLAKKANQDRSEWIRTVIRDRAERDRRVEAIDKEVRSYKEHPLTAEEKDDAELWASEVVWPE